MSDPAVPLPVERPGVERPGVERPGEVLPAPAVAQRPASLPARWRAALPALRRGGPLLMWRFRRLGMAGASGAGLVLFGLVFMVSTLLPQQRELGTLEQQLHQLRGPHTAAETAPARLDRFVHNLPRRADLPKVLGQVFGIAQASSVVLDRGHYELVPLRDGGFVEYRMSFPVKGRYTDIRHFIDGVLVQVPSVAVDGMRIERKAVGDGEVSADLRFAVILKGDGA